MRSVRTLAFFAAAFGLTAALSSAQSLAEVAKKEKERREKTTAGSKKTITERELATSYGGLPPGSSSGSRRSASGEGAKTEEGEKKDEPVVEDETKKPEYWQSRIKASKDRIAKLEGELQSEDWGEGQRMGVDPRGANNLGSRQQAEQQLAAARSELEAIRAEARRAGVPPGWVR
jgi:hypothetical protein